MDRLTEMEAFVHVVDLGGFTRAASKLGLSKSAISKHVASLEDRLGARLLNRTTRQVTPTEIGGVYYEKARAVLAAAGAADATATAMQGKPTGTLRISAPLSFGIRHVAPALAGFLAQYPEVSARLDFNDERIDLVAEGYDLAIRIGALPDSELKALKLAETTLRLVTSPDYIARKGAPETPEDLSDHDLLHYTHMTTGNLLRIPDGAGGEHAIRVESRLATNNGDVLARAAADGLGIAPSPGFICAEALETGALVEVLAAFRPAPLGIWAVSPAGRYPQPKTRVFIDHLAKALAASGKAL